MAGNSVIGALRVILGLDSAQFTKGLDAAQKELKRAGREMERTGKQLSAIGRELSLKVTLPILAMGAGAVKAAANFETAMNKVSISTKATAKEMAAMEVAARQIGKSTVFSASEAADAMDMLAKTGVSVKDILGGAAKAAVDLAAAAGSSLEPAASAIADTMQQFKMTAADLPTVVNQITGAVNESKLSFDDYTLAIGQVGGVAAGLGVSFKDFNAVIAGTSSLFSSGSDAGTSFKTFLTTLVPKSDAAAGAMEKYGLQFFEASGQMKSMSAIAEMLRTRLGGLSDEAKTEVLKEIFGADAMRTAIGLMDQGAAGLDKIAAKIAATDAAAQSAQRMAGFNGQLEQLKGSLEELSISIGKTGLLESMTRMITGVAGLVDRASAANPALLKMGVAVAAVAAAIGPVMAVIGGVVSGVGALIGILSAPITLPIVAAVAALVVAFLAFKDKIIPGLQQFWGILVETLGPKVAPLFDAVRSAVDALRSAFSAAFAGDQGLSAQIEVFGTIVARVFGAALDIITGAINTITNIFKAVIALLRGDFSGAWGYLGEAIKSYAGIYLNVFKTLFPEVVKWVKATYEGVKTWLVDKFDTIVNAVREKVTAVGDFFRDLWDRVVGHSYVPDMVKGVAEWMAKLDDGMVKPAKSATKAAAEAFETLRDDVAGVLEGLLTDTERKTRELRANMVTLRKALEAGPSKGGIDQATFQQAIDRMFPATATRAAFDASPNGLVDTSEILRDAAEDIAEAQEKASRRMEEAFGRTASAIDGVADAFRNRDWYGMVRGVQEAFKSIKTAFSGSGTTMDKVGAMAGVANSLGRAIGGKAGRALSGAASGALAGAQLGSIIPGIGTAIGAVVGGIIGGLASVLGPKPTNHGAGVAIGEGGQLTFSGEKRTSETEAAARSAAQGVLAGMEIMRQAGVKATNSVSGLVIGTRDPSQVYLASGKTLTAAIGDAGAAAEAGLLAVLETATFVSEAQEKLVKSMLAAGKGFDDISVALQGYAQAQNISKEISDQILAIVDPNAYTLQQLQEGQEARRAEVQAAFDAGFLTPEQLAEIQAKLATLEDVELAATLKGFGNAGVAADKMADALERARSELADLFRELTGSELNGLSPTQDLASAKSAFDQGVAGGADAASLNTLGRNYLAALRAGATSQLALASGVNSIKAGIAPLAGFADGGSFKVGGFGGVDSQLVAFRASPNEHVSVSHGDAMGQLAREVARLRADQRAGQAAIAQSTAATASALAWIRNTGLQVRGAAPGDPVNTIAA